MKFRSLFLFFWLSFIIFGTFYNQPGLEYEKFRQAKALALDFKLDIGNHLSHHSHASLGIDGKVYIHQPLGASVWLSPFVFIFQVLKADKWSYFLTKTLGVYGLQAFMLTLITLWLSLHFSLYNSFLSVGIVLFGTNWMAHLKTLGSDGISISWLVIGVCAAIKPKVLPKFLQKPSLETLLIFLAGLFGFWARYQMAVIVFPLIVFGFFSPWRKKSLIMFFGFFSGVVLQLIVNKITMGDWFTFAVKRSCFNSCFDPLPPGYIEPSSVVYWPFQISKIFGDLFSLQNGIFIYSPFLLYLFPILTSYRFKKEFYFLVLLGFIILIFTFIVNTISAGGWGARFSQSINLFWGIPIVVYLCQKKPKILPLLALILMINPYTFNGSFIYSAEKYWGELYSPELFMSLLGDFLRWSHVDMSESMWVNFWIFSFLCWMILLRNTLKKIKRNYS